MFSKCLTFFLSAFITVLFSGGLFAQEITTSSQSEIRTFQIEGVQAVLYDQTTAVGAETITSQQFGVANTAFNSQAADDFVVPTGEVWTIDSLLIPGTSSGLFAVSNVFFYADEPDTIPGTLVAVDTTAITSDAAGLLSISLSTPVVLSEGTYWVSVQPQGEVGVTGQWFWYLHTSANGNIWAWQNPGGGFGTNAASWLPHSSVTVIGPYVDNDLSFLLYGTVGSSSLFSDDFEAYTAGVQLVAQNNVDWDTWSGGGGTGEDPFVSDLFSYSGSNSIVEIPGNDFIRRHGDLTTGKWYMSFLFYIPTGQSGYFNTMSDFDGGFEWAMEVGFDVGGAGQVDTSGSNTGNTVDFTWAVAQWNQAVLVVDLDAVPPLAEFWTGTGPGTFRQIAAWDYTQGGTKLNQLAVNDFFGGTSTDEMYIDDYYFGDTLPEIIPVELTSFAANVNNNGDVILNWSTATELNNQMFEIERRSEEGQYLKIGYVDGHGTTTEAQEYSYIDNTVETGTFFYRLKQIDFLGTYEYSDEIEVEVNGPLTFELGQNYPNPFNPSTNINYSIPESGIVKLAIYNMLGEEVDVLVDGMVEAGFYEVSFDASNLPSGAYFYRLQSDKLNQVKKMLLLK